MCISEAESFISVMISAGSLLVAIGSFIVAAISLHKASKAQDLQNRVNELELQVKEHDLEAISQEIAAKISCWICGEAPVKDDNTIPVTIAKYSELPIYDVVVSIDIVDDNGFSSNYREDYTVYTYFVPPGCYYIYAPWHGLGMNKKFNSSITFRDAKGNWWCRDAYGNIEQSSNSLEKYGIMKPADSEQIYPVSR